MSIFVLPVCVYLYLLLYVLHCMIIHFNMEKFQLLQRADKMEDDVLYALFDLIYSARTLPFPACLIHHKDI